MKTENHTVTLPIADYNKLLEALAVENGKFESMKADLERLHHRSREFVSALSFLEEKGLLAEFNTRTLKRYRLETVDLNRDVKKLVED